MEIAQSAPVVSKKLWKIVRIVFMMLRKGIAKNKIMMEFHLLLKRGKLAASKAIANTLMLHHHHHANRDSFISTRDYEFSCSNSPAFPFRMVKRKHHHHYHYHHHGHPFDRYSKSCHNDEACTTVNAVQKVFEMLNSDTVQASPLVALPGFGKSPIGRQLRITDSPFPMKDEGDNSQVDMAAEEFFQRFYMDLNLQQKMAAIESPYHNLWDR